MDQSNQLDLIWIINVLWRRKWLILGLALLALIVSLIVVHYLPPVYKATTTLMIEQAEGGAISEYSMLMAGERLALTYSQIITSRPILNQVIYDLNLKNSVAELEDKITVQPVSDTQLIRITITNSSPYQVFMIANAIAETFIGYIDTLAAENYARSLSDIQTSIDQKQHEIDLILPVIDAQNQSKADLEADISRLKSLLSDNRSQYQILQGDVQSLGLTITQLNNKIRVVEPAHIDNPGATLTYNASLMMFFDQDVISGSSSYSGRISDLIQRVYGPMLVRESLLTEVINRLDLEATPTALAAQITYAAVPDTQFLNLTVSDQDASQALLIVENLANVFIEQNLASLSEPYVNRLVSLETEMTDLAAQMELTQEAINDNDSQVIPIDLELERLQGELTTKYADLRELQNSHDQYILDAKRSANSILITEPATQPTSSSSNNILYIGLSVIVSGIIGMGTAFILESLDDKIRTKEDIATLLDLQPVGTISHIEKGKDILIMGDNSSPHVNEDFRKLSAILRQAMEEVPVSKLLVTSPAPGEGKSTVAANLAIAIANTGSNVILVDADLHRPKIKYLFNLETERGLSEFLASRRKLPPVKATTYEHLQILHSGASTNEASTLLASPKLSSLINTLTTKADLVIIDCPPVLAMADASFITRLVDGVLLVINSGITTRKSTVEAMALIKMTKVEYLGVVLNNVATRQRAYYYYYDQEHKEAPKKAE